MVEGVFECARLENKRVSFWFCRKKRKKIRPRPRRHPPKKNQTQKTHHCPEGAGLASTWSTSIEQRALAISDASDSRRSPVGHRDFPLVGAMSFRAAATQSKPPPPAPPEEEEEEFDGAAEEEEGAGAGEAAALDDAEDEEDVGAVAGLVAAAGEDDDEDDEGGEGAGDAAAGATTAASLAFALGAAKGLTVGLLAPIASEGAAKPSVASEPGGGIPAPRSAPLAAAASSSSAGR